MKKVFCAYVVGSLFTCLQFGSAFAQGSLTPPGAPAPMMKTLAQVEPRTPISSLPYTITNGGSFYVTSNLTAVAGQNGISIGAGNVVVDLNGFTLRGVVGSLSGVYVLDSYTNIVVRNGVLTGWGRAGVDAYSASAPRNMFFENLTASENSGDGITTEAGSFINHCFCISNAATGISCIGGEIVDCTVRSSGGYGMVVQRCAVRGTRSEFNTGGGLAVANSTVSDCVFENNGSGGIVGNSGGYTEIRRCRAISNGSNGSNGGIYLAGGTASGVISDCLCATNTGRGITVFGQGFVISGNSCINNTMGGISIQNSYNRIEGNNVITLARVNGIEVPSNTYSNNVIVRNSVSGGTTTSFNYAVSTPNDLAPTGSASTATSPFANTSH